MFRLLEFLEINEGLFRKRMVRDKKIVTKWKTDRPGETKVVYDEFGNPHEERISNEEKREMKLRNQKSRHKVKWDQAKREQEKSFFTRRHDSELKHFNKKFPDVNSEEREEDK